MNLSSISARDALLYTPGSRLSIWILLSLGVSSSSLCRGHFRLNNSLHEGSLYHVIKRFSSAVRSTLGIFISCFFCCCSKWSLNLAWQAQSLRNHAPPFSLIETCYSILDVWTLSLIGLTPKYVTLYTCFLRCTWQKLLRTTHVSHSTWSNLFLVDIKSWLIVRLASTWSFTITDAWRTSYIIFSLRWLIRFTLELMWHVQKVDISSHITTQVITKL